MKLLIKHSLRPKNGIWLIGFLAVFSLPGFAGEDGAAGPSAESETVAKPEIYDIDWEMVKWVSEDDADREIQRQAIIQARLRNYDLAETYFIRLVHRQRTEGTKKRSLRILAGFHTNSEQHLKAISVYERFIKSYPADPGISRIYLLLGRQYRNIGEYQSATDAFFNVLKAYTKLPADQVEWYKEISEQAQIEIAETYYEIGNFRQAAEFYGRLEKSSSEEVRLEARIKQAYAHSQLGHFHEIRSLLENYPSDYAGSRYEFDARLLLVKAYRRLGELNEARREAVSILGEMVKPDVRSQWDVWRKRLGNEVANSFFAEKDYGNAHRLYMALLALSKDPTWRVPIFFQIAQCLEGQGVHKRAAQVYEQLIENVDDAALNTDPLQSILRQARIRLEHLNWVVNFDLAKEALAPQNHEPEGSHES